MASSSASTARCVARQRPPGARSPATAQGVHRGLGVHVTLVRSATMDKWSQEQLALFVASGGNARARTYFSQARRGPRAPATSRLRPLRSTGGA